MTQARYPRYHFFDKHDFDFLSLFIHTNIIVHPCWLLRFNFFYEYIIHHYGSRCLSLNLDNFVVESGQFCHFNGLIIWSKRLGSRII